jgi:hypothetical protein
MTTSIPPTGQKTRVAAGVSVACLMYAGSLALQRVVPALKEALALPLDGVKPTYYARVAASLLLGVVAAWLAPRRAWPERWVAVGTAVAVGVSVVLVCAFP